MNESEIKRYITQISNQYWPDKKNIIEYIDNNRAKENLDVGFNSNGFENNLSNKNDSIALMVSNEEKIEFINDIPIDTLNDCFKDDQFTQKPIQTNIDKNIDIIDINDINNIPIEVLNNCAQDGLVTQKSIQKNYER